MTTDARGGEAASVEIRYQLQLATGTDRVPFTVLNFEPARVGGITAAMGEEPLTVSITDPGPLRLEGELLLPEPVRVSGPVAVRLRYRVDVAVRTDGPGVHVVLPVVAVDWPPLEALPGTFASDIDLPDGMTAREVFPTTTPADEVLEGIAHASLQVVPSVVQVRARPAGSAAVSLPQALELVVLAVILGLGLLGLRFLRADR